MLKTKFKVHTDWIEEFLEILDSGECALITYQGYPEDCYIVELGVPILWDEDEPTLGAFPLD